MNYEEEPDYGEWTDQELADELADVEKSIEHCQNAITVARKSLNKSMDVREDLLDIIKQRHQVRKGWPKK